MKDLAEHVGTLWWATTGLLGICAILITLIWNSQAKKIEEIKKEAGKFSEWLRDVAPKEGGLVTRDTYYKWCKEQQEDCPACSGFKMLTTWRNAMLEKGGGLLTKNEHTILDEKNVSICKEMVRELANNFGERMEEMFEHHRVWVGQELKILSAQTTTVLSVLKKQMETENGRWEEHDEMTSKSGGKSNKG